MNQLKINFKQHIYKVVTKWIHMGKKIKMQVKIKLQYKYQN